jgi:hypothetical protein
MPGVNPKPLLALLGAAALALTVPGAATAQNNGQGGGKDNAQGRCELVIEGSPTEWVINHNPLTDTQATRQFDLSVVNRGEGPCTAVVSVDLRGEPFGLSHSGAPERLPYVLVEESGPTDLTPRAGESRRAVETRPVNLGPGERALLRFSLSINTGEALAAGLYSQTAYIQIDHPNGAPWTERPVTLGVRVASAALMGLKGEFTRVGGVATINLGQLSEGSRPLNTSLYVLSTSGYAVSVSSANGGRLRQGSSEWYIPYRLAVGDRPIDLSAPGRIEVVSTRPRFDDYPLAVSIGSVAGRRAGDYSDVVTFTIAAI